MTNNRTGTKIYLNSFNPHEHCKTESQAFTASMGYNTDQISLQKRKATMQTNYYQSDLSPESFNWVYSVRTRYITQHALLWNFLKSRTWYNMRGFMAIHVMHINLYMHICTIYLPFCKPKTPYNTSRLIIWLTCCYLKLEN